MSSTCPTQYTRESPEVSLAISQGECPGCGSPLEDAESLEVKGKYTVYDHECDSCGTGVKWVEDSRPAPGHTWVDCGVVRTETRYTCLRYRRGYNA